MVNYYNEKRRFLKQLRELLRSASPVSIKRLALLVLEKWGYSENTLIKTLELLEESDLIQVKNKEVFWIDQSKK